MYSLCFYCCVIAHDNILYCNTYLRIKQVITLFGKTKYLNLYLMIIFIKYLKY